MTTHYRTTVDPVETLFRSLIPPRATAPAIDWSADDSAYYLSLDVPGLTADGLKIESVERLLRVHGERNTTVPDGRTILRKERPDGEWEHTWTLPRDAEGDAITAHLQDGVLTLTIPRTKPVQPRSITVSTTAAVPEIKD